MSGGFSPEVKRHQIEKQNHRCALLKLEIDILEGHHCMPKCRGGSNNPHNIIEVAGQGAYCAYGVPVEDVHEKLDRLAIDEGLFLHPDTLEFVPRDQMPDDCFRNPNEKVEQKKHKKKKHHK